VRARDCVLLGGLAVAGIATLVYGALVEAERLVLERRRLPLPRWPKKLNGKTLAVLADLHIGEQYATVRATRAVEMALESAPDFVLIPGDVVSRWHEGTVGLAMGTLSPLAKLGERVIVSMGNHEYSGGGPEPLVELCQRLGFTVLRNEVARVGGITWAGIDSANAYMSEANRTMAAAKALGGPIVVLWHEPDVVDVLPIGAALMISGHSHGGQFRFPGGFTPMHTENGRKYVRGFHPLAPTPLYVSRGVGTTGPPSRLCCPPEVSLLVLESGE
jgi:hypothetical protein